MRAFVRFTLPDGSRRELVHGDLIGRLPQAALSLNEPTLSEAHAIVSLRGSQLKLLALRGRLAVAGRALAEVTLRDGLRIVLSSRVPLIVDEVRLPETVIAVEADALPQRVVAAVSALHLAPFPELRPGFAPDADALLWVVADTLFVRRPDEEDIALAPGSTFMCGTLEVRVVALPLESAGLVSTLVDGRHAPPLKLQVRYDTVHIVTQQGETHLLDGIPARIVSELALIGTSVEWTTVAREIWPDVDPAALRERWDASLGRLRRKLRGLGVRTDLVRATRSGQVELLLGTKDTVEDLA